MEDSNSSSDSSSYVTITLKTGQARLIADFLSEFNSIGSIKGFELHQEDIDVNNVLVDLEQRLNVALSPITNQEG